MRPFRVAHAPGFLSRKPPCRVFEISSAGSLSLTLAPLLGGYGGLPFEVVGVPLVLIVLIPRSVPRLDRLRIRRVPGSHLVSVPGLNLGPVFPVALPLQLASTFLVFRMPFSPPAYALTGFALPPLFLRLHSRASIRNRSS